MSEKTGITWCDSTFNGWWGCTEVTKGCDKCYARVQAAMYKHMTWGKDAPRIRTSESNWKEPIKWDRKAREEARMHKVFAFSMADIWDQEVPNEWRQEFFNLTYRTTNTWWLMLTKRPQHAKEGGYNSNHTWIGTSLTGNSDIGMASVICKAPGIVHWVSYEPALEPLDMGKMPSEITWYVVGGESGPDARPFNIEWARDLIEQGKRYKKAVFVKQLGSKPFFAGIPWPTSDSHGKIMSEWPEDLRVQEFPVLPKRDFDYSKYFIRPELDK